MPSSPFTTVSAEDICVIGESCRRIQPGLVYAVKTCQYEVCRRLRACTSGISIALTAYLYTLISLCLCQRAVGGLSSLTEVYGSAAGSAVLRRCDAPLTRASIKHVLYDQDGSGLFTRVSP